MVMMIDDVDDAHVHIYVTKWCTEGYGTGALWDLCNRSMCIIHCTESSWIYINSWLDHDIIISADSSIVPSQWEMVILCNDDWWWYHSSLCVNHSANNYTMMWCHQTVMSLWYINLWTMMHIHMFCTSKVTEIILCMCSANEWRLYSVMPSPIGWVHTYNDPCQDHTNSWSVEIQISSQ